MSNEMEDQVRRDMGGRARLALDALDMAIWKRSAEIIARAEFLLERDELTLERAHSLLISLVEQRKMASSLQGQVSEGIKAAHRINRNADRISEQKAEEVRAKTHGSNRFTRSKVG